MVLLPDEMLAALVPDGAGHCGSVSDRKRGDRSEVTVLMLAEFEPTSDG